MPHAELASTLANTAVCRGWYITVIYRTVTVIINTVTGTIISTRIDRIITIITVTFVRSKAVIVAVNNITAQVTAVAVLINTVIAGLCSRRTRSTGVSFSSCVTGGLTFSSTLHNDLATTQEPKIEGMHRLTQLHHQEVGYIDDIVD